MIDYSALAAEYARYRQVHPEVLRQLLHTGKVTSHSQVLEVGCGNGNYISRLRQATACGCWGIDPSEAMLAEARSYSPGVTLESGRAEALTFADEFFDLVFSVDVIHYIADPSIYFTHAQRILKPSGLVCTVTDSEWIIRNRVPLSKYFPETVEPELRRYPTLAQLRGWMQQAGFVDIQQVLVEYPYTLSDLRAYREKTFSALHLISQTAFETGLANMEADLQQGPIGSVSRYMMLWGVRM